MLWCLTHLLLVSHCWAECFKRSNIWCEGWKFSTSNMPRPCKSQMLEQWKLQKFNSALARVTQFETISRRFMFYVLFWQHFEDFQHLTCLSWCACLPTGWPSSRNQTWWCLFLATCESSAIYTQEISRDLGNIRQPSTWSNACLPECIQEIPAEKILLSLSVLIFGSIFTVLYVSLIHSASSNACQFSHNTMCCQLVGSGKASLGPSRCWLRICRIFSALEEYALFAPAFEISNK